MKHLPYYYYYYHYLSYLLCLCYEDCMFLTFLINNMLGLGHISVLLHWKRKTRHLCQKQLSDKPDLPGFNPAKQLLG